MVRMKALAWLPLYALVLAACGESTTPTQPEAGGEPKASTAALASDTWTPRAAMSAPRSAIAAGAIQNAAGQWIVHVFGGGDSEGTGFGGIAYNVVTDTWTGNGTFTRAGYINGVGRIGKRLYFTGGQSCCDVDFETYNQTWAFEPATGRLLQRANMPRATRQGVSGVIDGMLYVLPGYCSGESVDTGHCTVGGPIRQLYRYNPSTNTWTTRRQAPRFHTNGGGAVIGDKFYVVGGQSDHLDVYDPATNTWTTRAPIPARTEQAYAAALQGKLFVVSATFVSGSGWVIKAFQYDPSTNKWTPRSAPPTVAGAIVKVELNGQPRLFLPGTQSSYLYTP